MGRERGSGSRSVLSGGINTDVQCRLGRGLFRGHSPPVVLLLCVGCHVLISSIRC